MQDSAKEWPREKDDCQLCDTSDGTGPLKGERRRVGLFRHIIACDECWYGRNNQWEGKVVGGVRRT